MYEFLRASSIGRKDICGVCDGESVRYIGRPFCSVSRWKSRCWAHLPARSRGGVSIAALVDLMAGGQSLPGAGAGARCEKSEACFAAHGRVVRLKEERFQFLQRRHRHPSTMARGSSRLYHSFNLVHSS